MTKNKDIKRLIRARMEKTGESYTTARAHLLRKKPAPVPDDYADLAGMSDDAVAAKTGRTWPEWVRTLDEIGATELEHPEIARWVGERVESGWWAQTVTVGYERIRGLRDVGQRRGGLYEANKSRTIGAPVKALYRAFVDDDVRRQWLDADLAIRKATPHKSVRMTWSDKTTVNVHITEKGPSKGTVQLHHRKLTSSDAREEAKTFWGERLEALKALLE